MILALLLLSNYPSYTNASKGYGHQCRRPNRQWGRTYCRRLIRQMSTPNCRNSYGLPAGISNDYNQERSVNKQKHGYIQS